MCAHLSAIGNVPRHLAVGLRPLSVVRFVVKQINFFGSSDFSEPSEAVIVPERQESSSSDPSSDDVQHCPFFMAGFCRAYVVAPLSCALLCLFFCLTHTFRLGWL